MQTRTDHGEKLANQRITSTVRSRLQFHSPYKTDHYSDPIHLDHSAMLERINIDDTTQRWVWTCPRGHRTWEPTNFHFWCAACARANDAEASFQRIHNARDGRTLSRAEIELVDRTGETIEELTQKVEVIQEYKELWAIDQRGVQPMKSLADDQSTLGFEGEA